MAYMTRKNQDKLSPRAVELLTLIDAGTEWLDGHLGTQLANFYVPRGDARVLRSLCEKGLIRNHSKTHPPSAYSITETGIFTLEGK